MCQCTPNIRTPWCGKGTCHPPRPEGTRPLSAEGVDLPVGIQHVSSRRLSELLSGYEEFRPADYFEIRSLAYEVRNSRMAFPHKAQTP